MVDRHISIAKSIAKKGLGQRVPLHPDLKVALVRLIEIFECQRQPRAPPTPTLPPGTHAP